MLSFTSQLALTIQTRTVLSKKVLVFENVAFDVSCIKPDAAEQANEVDNHSNQRVPGHNRRGGTDRGGAACLLGAN